MRAKKSFQNIFFFFLLFLVLPQLLYALDLYDIRVERKEQVYVDGSQIRYKAVCNDIAVLEKDKIDIRDKVDQVQFVADIDYWHIQSGEYRTYQINLAKSLVSNVFYSGSIDYKDNKEEIEDIGIFTYGNTYTKETDIESSFINAIYTLSSKSYNVILPIMCNALYSTEKKISKNERYHIKIRSAVYNIALFSVEDENQMAVNELVVSDIFKIIIAYGKDLFKIRQVSDADVTYYDIKPLLED